MAEKYIRFRKGKRYSKYEITIPYTDDEGQRVYFSKTVKLIDYENDKKLALSAAKKIRNDALLDIESGKMKKLYPTVDYLYRTSYVLIPKSQSTKNNYDPLYKSMMGDLKDKRINTVKLWEIQLAINNCAQSLTKDRVSRLKTIWKKIYKTANMLGYEITDLSDSVILPKPGRVVQPRSVTFSQEDFKTILNNLYTFGRSEKSSYNYRVIYYMLQIMYYTGCRPGEARALTRSDITENSIHINKSIGFNPKGEITTTPPKTNKSTRSIPIVPELKPILQELIQWSRNEYLLSDYNGNLIPAYKITNMLRYAAKRKNIEFRPYMLRHLMSSDLLHAGDSAVARDLLGHTSFGQTLDYARSTDEQILNAMQNRFPSNSQQSPNNLPTFSFHFLPPSTDLNRSFNEWLILSYVIGMRLLAVFSRFKGQ